MLPRTLEPDVMDGLEEVETYESMPHDEVNERFVADALALLAAESDSSDQPGRRLLDLGTGPALIPLLFARQESRLHITAVDLSAPMLAAARSHIERLGLDRQIALEVADTAALPFPTDQFDVVVSNSLIHHLADPLPTLREAVRVLRPGGCLFVRDLFRPVTTDEVERLTRKYGGETALSQQLLRQSLHAALTLPEISALTQKLPGVQAEVRCTSDRHWTITGRKLCEESGGTSQSPASDITANAIRRPIIWDAE